MTIHIIPNSMSEQIVRPGMSTIQIMETFRRQDAGEIQLTRSEITDLAHQLRAKPDNIRRYLDELEDDAALERKYAREHAEEARLIEAKIERDRQRLAWAMKEYGWESLVGEEFEVSLARTVSTKVDDIEITPGIAEKYSEFLATKYEWRKKEIKAALDAGIYDLPFARLEESYHPQFRVRRRTRK